MKILKEYKNTKNKIGHIAQLYHRILLLQLTIKLGWHYQAENYTLRILDPVKILWMNNDQVLTPHRVCDKPEVFLKDCNVLCGLTWGVSKGLHCLVWFNCSLFSEHKNRLYNVPDVIQQSIGDWQPSEILWLRFATDAFSELYCLQNTCKHFCSYKIPVVKDRK